MGAHEVSRFGRSGSEAAKPHDRNLIPPGDAEQATSPPAPDEGESGKSRMLALIPATPDTEPPSSKSASPAWAFVRSGLAAAAAAALAVAIGAAVLLVNENRRRDNLFAINAQETASLTRSLKALSVRLDAIESAGSGQGLVELRRSIGDMKSGAASARDPGGALAQLSQRVEKLDREVSAKVDSVGERVDRDANKRTTELATRIEKLEKRPVAPIVGAPPGPAPPAQTKQSARAPRFGPNVSMETTGSIQRPRAVLQGYIVLDGRYDAALVGGRYGEREVRLGDFLPGAGRVERIERRGGGWVVLTDEGLIGAAEAPPY